MSLATEYQTKTQSSNSDMVSFFLNCFYMDQISQLKTSAIEKEPRSRTFWIISDSVSSLNKNIPANKLFGENIKWPVETSEQGEFFFYLLTEFTVPLRANFSTSWINPPEP